MTHCYVNYLDSASGIYDTIDVDRIIIEVPESETVNPYLKEFEKN